MKLNKYWRIINLSIALLFCTFVKAQYSWIYLSDKNGVQEDFFNQPISDNYKKKLSNNAISILGESRWLNAVCVPTHQINKAIDLPFVSYISPLENYKVDELKTSDTFSYGASDWQIEMLGLDQYHQKGYTGKGVKLALFDAGFYKVDSLAIFDYMWANNQIIATYDFVANDTMSYRQSRHGMQVLALAGINYPDSMIGAAPNAQFVLARTEEVGKERHIEELFWVKAMEWADSIGVDIIHSSLGYSEFDSLQGDYTYTDMDGESTIITKAAELATRRGIFITNSAGNQGNDPWFYITAPCDGRNVLCVGAVDSFKTITAFSSRGPSSDGRIKPDVVAMGRRNTVPSSDGKLMRGNGTSFSGPLVAGLVACLKQAHPNVSNSNLFNAILKSCNQYSAPDNEYGYGIPNAIVADSILRKLTSSSNKKKTSSISNLEIFQVSPSILKITAQPNSNYFVINQEGKIVTQGVLNNWINFIDISELNSGLYYLSNSYQSHTQTKKWFKY